MPAPCREWPFPVQDPLVSLVLDNKSTSDLGGLPIFGRCKCCMQILIFEALGFTPPVFGHLSLILAPDRSKMSKRHGATSVTEFRGLGYLPQVELHPCISCPCSRSCCYFVAHSVIAGCLMADKYR